MSIEVSLNHIPVINFSMQQNHVPVIREIIVKNDGEADLEGVDIAIAFDPDFAEAPTLHIERIGAGKSARLTDIPVHISTTFLSNLTERIEGLIKVDVTHGGESLFTQSYEISLLAFDQWSGITVLPAMLAAFVTPNHPEVQAVIRRASEILGKWTGAPSMDEYQTRDPNRVKLQMAAIFEAISERQIAYCAVPASFEDRGQRVRLYSDIFSTRLATCLDMALLYAGCLEAAGLHPLLVVVKGHAFAGGWLIQESFPDSVNDDVSLLTKRTPDGINEILLVETTCMNAGNGMTFDEARAAADGRLKDTDSFLLFVDVLRARNARIRPLPLRVMRDGVFEVEEPVVTERDHEAPAAMSETHIVTHTDHIEVGKQTIWERKLLDLSLRNNLLNTRITNNTLQLIPANVNELEDALAAGEEFRILPRPSDWDNPLMSAGMYQTVNASHPVMDLVRSELKQNRLYSYLNEEALRRVLTHLYRSSRLSLEENGANTLYLAVGLLKWFETPASTRPRYAPLLLLPIEIIRKTAAKGYIIRSRDEDTALNITLLEMLRQNFGIGIGGLDPLPADESGVDVPQIFSVFRRAVMAQPGWDVEEQVIIGNFSFNKFIMWNDIHRNAGKLSRNKIVASLISGVTELGPDDIPAVHADLDEEYPAGSVALPIGADSSQFEAICAAVEGKSFILHGPPGTGKSQTITNIIANALYNGKKVLFVAEKMAALQVVQRRLEAIGLAPFCLELHSNKTKKSYILEQLKRTTEVLKKKPAEDFRIKAGQINDLRRELNGYVRALHKVWPSGLSLYDCFARYASVPSGTEPVKISAGLLDSLTPASLAEAEVAAGRLETITRLCGSPARHPLAGIQLTDYRRTLKSEAHDLLLELVGEIDRYQTAVKELSALMKYDFSREAAENRTVLDEILGLLFESENIPAALLKTAGSGSVFALMEKTVECGRARDKARDAILTDFTDDILSWDFRPWEVKWRTSAEKWWLPRFFARRSVRSQLRYYSRSKALFSPEEISRLFTELATYARRQRELECLGHDAAPFLGSLWSLDRGDWNKVEAAAGDTRRLHRLIVQLTRDVAAASQFTDALYINLQSGYETFRELFAVSIREVVMAGKSIGAKTAALSDMLKADNLAAMPLAELRDTATRWAANMEMLHDRAAYNQQRDAMKALGYDDFARAVDEGKVDPDDISRCFSRSLYRAYAEHILAAERELNAFHGVLFDEKIERFRLLSHEFERLTRGELYARLASSLPALQKEAAQTSEVGILQRNIRNGGRGTSIRRLFDQIPDLLTRMCPCMLMSPISVAQYIDADNVPFDLVIFDEASQMPTSEAVGAIARGRSVIVVGDPKQMPPTTFFATSTFDEDNADKEDMENILEDCLALSMPSKHLLWHYRSRHESLIAFSNANYYDNRLLTFPSPDDLTTKVGWQYVEGVYDRGKTRQNRAEAEAVIDEISRRLSDPASAGRSIGVVTFNTNQQSLIEDLLNDLFSHNPALEAAATELDEPIFIKNLENVQGDERDVILFSIGYGPDKDGKVALNFGPLNRDGGGRRLNVAVSRARYEMKVFSSLRADMIDLNRTSAEGVADLKAFLEYAEKGREYLAGRAATDDTAATDGLVEALSAGLKERGYNIRTGIGCSGYRIDIGVVDPADPDKYLIGILCDGYRYSSAGTAGDRVVTQDAVLRGLGWRLCRIWSMDWWENPAKTLDDVIRAIGTAEAETKAEAEAPHKPTPRHGMSDTSASHPAADISTETEEETDPRERPYGLSLLHYETLSAEEFISGAHDRMILDKIAAVISHEAPVSKSLLYKRVLSSYGFSRTGTRLATHLDRLLATTPYIATGTDTIFYWADGQNPAACDFYRPRSEREPLDIAPEEIAVAITRILGEQVSLPVDSLKREVAQMFGYNRLGDNVNASITRAIGYALDRNLIILSADRIKLP
ncbi:MAG: DUF3320 domain-containing protein [Duncaniella sp.]|nr:DUF3320 domain-containing protein [Duncaniella sp.]